MGQLAKVSGYAVVAALMIAGPGARGTAQNHDDHGCARSEPHKRTPQENELVQTVRLNTSLAFDREVDVDNPNGTFVNWNPDTAR